MLVRMVVWPVWSIGKRLDVTGISTLPSVDVLTVHVVLDGCFRYAVFFGVLQKWLTKLHSLCYTIHDECVALSVWVLSSNLTVPQDDPFVFLFILLCNTSIVILHGRFKNEVFYGFEKDYSSFEAFSNAIAEYIDYYNNSRIQAKTKWMPPSKFREASMMDS